MRICCDIENIAFVGGPCSGKTSVFEALRSMEHCCAERVCLSFVEEAATRILPRDPQLARRDPLRFQYEVSLLQYIAEDRGMELLLGRPETLKVQLTDRGVADAYIYLNERQAREMSDQTPEEMLHRYTAVFYFDPYKSQSLTDGNAFRVEHAEEMDALEQRTRRIWEQHPRLIRVPTFPTIEERIRYTAAQLNALLTLRVFDECFTVAPTPALL